MKLSLNLGCTLKVENCRLAVEHAGQLGTFNLQLSTGSRPVSRSEKNTGLPMKITSRMTSLTARVVALGLFALTSGALGGTTSLPPVPSLPDAGLSVLRVFGALALVLALFFGGVWLFRNWQRLMLQRGRAPRLNIVETRPLGNRQALYVIAYDEQRMLVSSSPAGVTLLSHLPPADKTEAEAQTTAAPALSPISFAQTLQQLLARR